jgi:hypothetical protein
MTATFIHGDHVSCSRVGGAMRRESSRLHLHAQSLNETSGALAAWEGPERDAAMAAVALSLEVLRATADDLDRAGAILQRYATDLAEGHELGRRAERRVQAAGLLLEGTRVTEPWGPASTQEAERRRAQVPGAQARVDLATAHVGRARGTLERDAATLTEAFERHSRAAHSRPAPMSQRRS